MGSNPAGWWAFFSSLPSHVWVFNSFLSRRCITTDFPTKKMLSRAAWGEASLIRMDWAKQKLHDEERRKRGKICSIPKHQDSKATWVSCPGRVTLRWYWQKCRRRPRRWSRSAGRCRLWALDTSSRRPSGCLRTCSSSLWECRPARIKKTCSS